MDTFALLARITVALLTAGIIGLEREKTAEERKLPQDSPLPYNFGGIRTHLLFSVLGILAGFAILGELHVVAFVISAGLVLMVLASFVLSYIRHKMYGLTSEIGALITFFIAIFLVLDLVPVQVIVTLGIISALILGMKRQVRLFVKGFTRDEIIDIIKFALVAIVILPILPDKWYGLSDIPVLEMIFNRAGFPSADKFMELPLFNPFKLWFIVVFVSGLDFAGYLVNKMFGGTGELIAGITGGFVTSTATVNGLAIRSRKFTGKRVVQLAAIACMTNSASYIQTMVLVAPLNIELLLKFAPFLMMLVISGFVIGLLTYRHNLEAKTQPEAIESGKGSFAIVPAIKFALLLLTIQIVSKLALASLGNVAFFITSIIASLTGIDAVVINLTELAGTSITFNTALFTFFAVTAMNTLSKVGISRIVGGTLFMKTFLALSGTTFILSLLFGLALA